MRGFGIRRKGLKFFIGAAAVWLLAAATVCGARLPFKNYTTAEGLADDRVNRVIQDSRGFLWFCTSEGLSRFDGYEFRNYTQADGLPHRIINDLIELDDGTYLVGTYDGLAVFNPKGEAKTESGNKKFRVFRPPDTKADGKAAAVRDLQKTRDGKIWAATMDGFYRLSREEDGEWRFTRIESELWRSDSRLLEFTAVLEDRRGALWLGMPSGLFRFEPEKGKISLVFEGGVQSFLEDRKGRVWVGSGSGSKYGINVYDFPEETNQPVLIKNFTTKNGLATDYWINCISETSDGRILIASTNDLSEFLPDASAGEPDFRSLVTVDAVSLGEDAGGNVWIGTETRGALKLARHGFLLFGEQEGVPAKEIFAIIPGNGDEIFVASGSDELLRFDGEKFVSVRPKGMTGRGWGWNQIDFRSRVDGDWWIATYLGVRRYAAVEKLEDLARIAPKKIYKIEDGLYTEEVFRMWEDSRGNVWIYVFGKVGDDDSYLHLWERATDKIRHFGKADGLPHVNNVTAFAEDKAGNVWLGFYAGGAARLRDGRFQHFSVKEGFPNGFLGAAYTDRAGRVWLATGNSGIVRVDNPTDDAPRFVNITVAEGLSSNSATCFTEDNFGRVYVGTGHGISRIEPESGHIKFYSQADGLPYSAVRTCGRDADGNLWFAQKFNLARLTPEAEEKQGAPPIFIGDLEINGEKVKKLSELGETSVENLELNPEQRQIQIGFFALGFGTGENLRYQYRFAGGNDEWSEPSAQRTVNLNLAPGVYNFEVRAVNSEGTASENPARVSFSIARPVWQRWWFLLIAAAAVSGVIYALYRYRVKRLLELERVRTRIATDLHDDIGSSLSQIAILSEVVRQKIGANEAAMPLNMIADTSREMVDSMSDIVWAINPDKDYLADLAHRMRRFASDVLEAQDIAYRFSFDERDGKIALGADIRREVYLIFKESINNLVKHAAARNVEMAMRIENNSLFIEIKDDGRGFDPNEILNGNYDGFGGNGLINMRRRAAALGGSLALRSRKNAGTNITIKIPLK